MFEEKREQVTEQRYMLERSLVCIEFETRCPWCAAQVTTEVWFEKTSRKP